MALSPAQIHRMHIFRRLMKRAKVDEVDSKMKLLVDFDRSEKVIPIGQVSKKLYEDLFDRREFDLYGRFMGYVKIQPPRKHMELSYHAKRLKIEYKQTFDYLIEDEDMSVFQELKAKKEKEQAEEEEETKKVQALLHAPPTLVTPQWALERMALAPNPVGLSQNPIQPLHSLGNEKHFSYNGLWKMGKMNGKGLYQFNDGKCVEGLWVDNKQQGFGTADYPGGQSYAGDWSKGRWHGKGVFKSVCGSGYEGYSAMGRRDGHGRLDFSSGLSYEGDFKDGRPHGRGVMRSRLTGWSYEGNFVRGYIEGIGSLISPPPAEERITQFWPESRNEAEGLLLPALVRKYLKEKQAENEYFARNKAEMLGPLRGSQLKHYVQSIRSSIYTERLNIKKNRFNAALQAAKDQKKKLFEARMTALLGDENKEEEEEG